MAVLAILPGQLPGDVQLPKGCRSIPDQLRQPFIDSHFRRLTGDEIRTCLSPTESVLDESGDAASILVTDQTLFPVVREMDVLTFSPVFIPPGGEGGDGFGAGSVVLAWGNDGGGLALQPFLATTDGGGLVLWRGGSFEYWNTRTTVAVCVQLSSIDHEGESTASVLDTRGVKAFPVGSWF